MRAVIRVIRIVPTESFYLELFDVDSRRADVAKLTRGPRFLPETPELVRRFLDMNGKRRIS